ncbi:MAG: TIGR03936 family radical SAM-associated protein, partial [Cyanobium sp.]
RGVRTAMESGYRKLKLYFMIGLPGECDADVLGIADTCRSLQERCRDLGRLELNLTISNFTPKPHTPFQWHSVSTVEFRRRQELLRRALRQLRGIKVNTTDVRLSAVEDFIGRSDRRLAPVIEAAWRAGAGLDAWFESAERTHTAWTTAMEEAGLEGRYRQLEMGGWGAAETLTPEQRASFCGQPLPWDHIDSGVDKVWLAEDLHRALDAAVVPDCSFEGCSHCGVCGPELGHNVVIPPPPVPPALPPRAPASERLCRLRFGFARTGSLARISHLDSVRLMERALRRTGLPVSFTGGFHPLPRLQFALSLPLGVEGLGEWFDLEFAVPAERLDADTTRRILQEELPEDFQLLSVAQVPVSGPSLSQEIERAHWRFHLRPAEAVRSSPTERDWQGAITDLLAAPTLVWNDKDKKGRPRSRDCRPALLRLHCSAWEPVGPGLLDAWPTLELEAAVDPAGRSLRPEQIAHWLGERLAIALEVSAVKRRELSLRAC